MIEHWDHIRPLLAFALDKVRQPPDDFLFQNNVYEIAIAHRIAMYFEDALRKENKLGRRTVDCDFNKVAESELLDSKRLSGADLKRALEQLPELLAGLLDSTVSASDLASAVALASHKVKESNSPIRPDLVLHERGNNNSNCLVAEIKVNNNRGLAAVIADCARLLVLTTAHPSRTHYEFGLFLDYSQSEEKEISLSPLLFTDGLCYQLNEHTLSVVSG